MDRDLLASLVASAATRSSAPATDLWSTADDRTVPAARDWVRRWGPRPAFATMRECACAAGRCSACN